VTSKPVSTPEPAAAWAKNGRSGAETLLERVDRAAAAIVRAGQPYEGLFPSLIDRHSGELLAMLPPGIPGQRTGDRSHLGCNLIHDESLLAPILSHDRYLTSSRNFCDNVPAWRLTLYRLLVLLNFYPISFLSHPRRVWRTLRNVFAGREESKLDSFLRNYVKYWRVRLRRSAATS